MTFLRMKKIKFPKFKFPKFKAKRGRKSNVLAQASKLATGLALVGVGASLRKRVTVGPVTLNLSKQGISSTIGTHNKTPFLPQASINIGKNGAYLNTSLVGTGAYKRTKLTDTPRTKSFKIQEENEKRAELNRTYKEIMNNENTLPEVEQNNNSLEQNIEQKQEENTVILNNLNGNWSTKIPRGQVFNSPLGFSVNHMVDGGVGTPFCPYCEGQEIGEPDWTTLGIVNILIFFLILSIVGIIPAIILCIWAESERNKYRCLKCGKIIHKNDIMLIQKV